MPEERCSYMQKKKKMWPTDTVAGVSIVGVLLLLVFL